jgi:hypothetical protein
MSDEQKASKYAGNNPQRAIRLNSGWPQQVKDLLSELAVIKPLSARLGEAWILQKGYDEVLQAAGNELLWDSRPRQWWRKERIDLALVQIAGRCQQRPFWCGAAEVVDLSGGDVLTFLSICQFIWDAWLQVSQPAVTTHPPPITVGRG